MQIIILIVVLCAIAIYWKQFAAFAIILVALGVFLYIKSSKKLSKVFNDWEKNIHDTSEQKKRVYRAQHDGLELHRFTGNESAEVVGTSGEIYNVTLHSCSCPDFEERQLPCKHMYFLAKESGKLSKFDLWFFSEEPKEKKKNFSSNKANKTEKFSTHGATFTIHHELKDVPIKKVKLDYKAINKVIAQKNNSYYGYTGMYDFEIRGTNVKTNHRKKIRVQGTSEEEAKKNAEAQGILPPYEIENILVKEPYEEKIEYAKSLGIKVPEKCFREDIYALIEQVENNDTVLVSSEFLEFARKRGIYISALSGEKTAYTTIFYSLTGADKIAMFAFMIYKNITNDIATNFEDCRYKDKFIAFAQQQLENPQFTKSFKRHCSNHEYMEIAHFGPYIDEDGVKRQGICSQDTIIYKTTVEFLKQSNMI